MITGASSGIGAHLALAAAAAGARVVVAARRLELLDRLASEIVAIGEEAMAVSMDVTEEASVIRAFDAAITRFGPVDTVIACAGVALGAAAVDQSAEDFAKVLSINVLGTFLTLREAARRLIASTLAARGRMVVISSITAQQVAPGLASYSASKAAVLQMGRVLAREWARQGICVNIVLPGYIRTELNSEWFDSTSGAKQIASWPRRRLMDVSQLDAVILHLCSDCASGTTGAAFTVDDGQTL
jgi:NAD(P)-dependent dehydrogenase (short-subunit alcohol dehydrogenase family)